MPMAITSWTMYRDERSAERLKQCALRGQSSRTKRYVSNCEKEAGMKRWTHGIASRSCLLVKLGTMNLTVQLATNRTTSF